jgi:putative transcription antitermination factor YqgF
MSVLAIDHGKKFCGFAVEIAGISFPKSIVPTSDVLIETERLVYEYSVSQLVIWIAPNMDGSKSKQEGIQKVFASELKKKFPSCEIIFVNEAFSTKQAKFEREKLHKVQGLHYWGIEQNERIDDMAAAIILENFLSSQK